MEFLMRAGGLLALCGLLLVACAASDPRAVQYLDERTAATITRMDAPWIFAHESPQLAVHARDYLDMRAVDVNRSGQHRLYLQLDLWSTIDLSEVVSLQGLVLHLQADDRVFPLRCEEDGARYGIGTTRRAHGEYSRTFYCATERAMLEFLATAESVRVRLTREEDEFVFESWRDGRGGLREFVGVVR